MLWMLRPSFSQSKVQAMPDPALSGLYGLRAGDFGWPEVLAAAGLGLLFAVLIGLALHLFRGRPRRAQDPVEAAHDLPGDVRALVLAGLLKDATDRAAPGETPWPERAEETFGLDPATVRQLANLYQPGTMLDPDPVERALNVARRR